MPILFQENLTHKFLSPPPPPPPLCFILTPKLFHRPQLLPSRSELAWWTLYPKFDKLMPMESSFNLGSSSASSFSVVTPTNMTEADCFEVGPKMSSSVFANSEVELPTTQPSIQMVSQHQNEQLLHQLLNQKGMQPRIESSSTQLNFSYSQQRQERSTLLLPPELQSSHQPSFTAIQEQCRIEQQPAAIELHQLLGFKTQSNPIQEVMHQMRQTWTPSLPQNDIIGQQKRLELSRRLFPETSSASVDSTCRTESICSSAWNDQGYLELQSVREMHLSELTKLYRRACDLCLQPSSAELAAKYEKTRTFIEKMVRFLNMPRTDIVSWPEEKFYSYLDLITNYLDRVRKGPVSAQQYGHSQSQVPQLQQLSNTKFQFQAANPGLTRGNAGSPLPLFLAQEGGINSQAYKIESDHSISLTGVELRNAPSQLQHAILHQYASSRPQKTNTVSSVHNSSLIGMEQQNDLDPVRHGGIRSSYPSSLYTLQQINFPHRSAPPNSTTPFIELKQRTKSSTRHTQVLNQPMSKPLTEEKKQQMLMQKVNKINEKQQIEYSPQPLLLSAPHFKVTSGVTSSLSFEHVDREKLPFPSSKAGTPTKSAASPFILNSPSSPAMPSSSPVGPEKHSSVISSFSVEDNSEHPQTPVGKSTKYPQTLLEESSGHSQTFVGVTLASIQNQLLALGTPEISASLSHAEFTFPEETQRTSDKELSPKCLIETVQSISSRALIAATQDIFSVVILIERLSGSAVSSESLVAICDDLAADTVHRSGRRNFVLQCEGTPSNMMKRCISTRASSLLSSCNEIDRFERVICQASDLELPAASRKKRQRTEAPLCQLNDAILEEIRQINQSLIETVIDVVPGFNEGVDADFHLGATVRCSYSAVGLDENFKQQNASLRRFPILLVQLFIPTDYPLSSPLLSDAPPISCSAGEWENLSERAKLRFSLSLRKLSEPLSLTDIAKAWDDCARTVFSEYVESIGGGSFSSTYGTWESCATAA